MCTVRMRCVERRLLDCESIATRVPPSRYVSDKEGVSRSRDISSLLQGRDDREEKEKVSRAVARGRFFVIEDSRGKSNILLICGTCYTQGSS
jgi:hypothetical protein